LERAASATVANRQSNIGCTTDLRGIDGTVEARRFETVGVDCGTLFPWRLGAGRRN